MSSSCSASAPSIRGPLIAEPRSTFIHMLSDGVILLAKWQGVATTVESCFRRVSAFVRDCWWKVTVMHEAFEQSESAEGQQSRERSEERGRDEEAWARMDNEGGPGGREQPYPRQDIIRTESAFRVR